MRIENEREFVGNILLSFLNGQCRAGDWDDFLHSEFKDQQLNAIRSLCSLLPDTHPPDQKGHYCNEEGAQIIRELGNRLVSK